MRLIAVGQTLRTSHPKVPFHKKSQHTNFRSKMRKRMSLVERLRWRGNVRLRSLGSGAQNGCASAKRGRQGYRDRPASMTSAQAGASAYFRRKHRPQRSSRVVFMSAAVRRLRTGLCCRPLAPTLMS
eukprot:01980_5